MLSICPGADESQMPISRNKAIAFVIVVGSLSVAVALALNITWLIRWREVGMVVLGIIFFGFVIAGVTLNTIFLVREMRRNEQSHCRSRIRQRRTARPSR